jgi:hypothetical protein
MKMGRKKQGDHDEIEGGFRTTGFCVALKSFPVPDGAFHHVDVSTITLHCTSYLHCLQYVTKNLAQDVYIYI